MSRESIRRAIRTFLAAVLGLWIPGLLGWLNQLTEWAHGEGSTPFPDAHGLAYLGVAAISAGVIATVQLVINGIEDASGKGFLRDVPPRTDRGQGGTVTTFAISSAFLVLVIIGFVLILLRGYQ